VQGPPQGPPACAASTGVSFPAHQHREDSASPTSARSCTARLAARLAAPGCAAHPRGPPRARCPNLPRTQARAESVLHAPSWTRRLLAAPVHPARPRSPALDTRAARARRWPAPARLRQHAHRLSRWLFAIEIVEPLQLGVRSPSQRPAAEHKQGTELRGRRVVRYEVVLAAQGAVSAGSPPEAGGLRRTDRGSFPAHQPHLPQ